MAEMLGNKNHSNDQGISQWTSKYRKQDVFCVMTSRTALDMITYCGVFDEILIVQNNMPGAVEVF